MNLAVKDECSFKIICSDFFVNYEVSIGVIMDTLITNAVKCSPPIAEWIFAVPMLHFMTKKCKPYEQLRGLSWNYADSTRQVYFQCYVCMYSLGYNKLTVHYLKTRCSQVKPTAIIILLL